MNKEKELKNKSKKSGSKSTAKPFESSKKSSEKASVKPFESSKKGGSKTTEKPFESSKNSGGKSGGKPFNARKNGGGNRSIKPYKAEDALKGRIDGSGKGYGFFVPENGGDDLFIPPQDMNGALNSDIVLAVFTGQKRGAGEARVVEILERGNKTVVGTFSKNPSGSGFVSPDNIRLGTDIHVSANNLNGAKNGNKVVVKLISYEVGKSPEGNILEVLGNEGDSDVNILSIIRSYNLYEEFPKSVIGEAKNVPDSVANDKINGRKDFRGEIIVTIDGDDSKDFDDAVTVTKSGSGYKLGVHIADVSEYVLVGTKLDKEAFKRGTSVYFVDRVFPMLPVQLSNGICSLNEGEDRLTLSVLMETDANGNVIKHKITEGVINSKARLTYSKVAKILDGDVELCAQYAEFVPMLRDMRELTEKLNKLRTARGNIEFNLPESQIELGENGKIKNISFKPRLISHKIIEEFMLAANETVAEHFESLKCPFVYRAHAEPPYEKVETLVGFLAALGIPFGGNMNAPVPKDFAKLLASVDENVAGIINRVTLRSMTKASYEPVNKGHFGLAAPYYCHFTSPIRRYPDLMIHRIIKDYLSNGEKAFKKYENVVGDVSKQSSERERLAEQAERKVDDLFKAEFMADKVGNRYTGIISGVTEWNLYVELPNSVEGAVRVETLPGNGFIYNAQLMRLYNAQYQYKLGDEINIVVDRVDGDRVLFLLDI